MLTKKPQDRSEREMYRQMYLCMERAAFNALVALEDGDIEQTLTLLKNAQCEAEDIFVGWEEKGDPDTEGLRSLLRERLDPGQEKKLAEYVDEELKREF